MKRVYQIILVGFLSISTIKTIGQEAIVYQPEQLIANIHDGHTQAYTFGKLGSIINNQERLPFLN